MAILQTSENENEKIHSSSLFKVNMRGLGYFSKHYYKFEEKNEKWNTNLVFAEVFLIVALFSLLGAMWRKVSARAI